MTIDWRFLVCLIAFLIEEKWRIGLVSARLSCSSYVINLICCHA